MDKVSVSFPELGLFAATRGMAGLGLGLMFANKLSRENRKALGLPLFIIGALSTIPFAVHLFRNKELKTEE
jgi:hypothetical protein